MSKGINRCMFYGMLIADAYTHIVNNIELVHFKLQIDEPYKAGREWKTQTEIVPCTWAGPRARSMMWKLRKGTAVFVEGKFHTNTSAKSHVVGIRVTDISTIGSEPGDAAGEVETPYDT